MATECLTIPPPFSAHYDVYQDNKAIGKAKIELHHIGNNLYKYKTETEGTRGLAALLGGYVSEETTWSLVNNYYQPEYFEYQQKIAFNNRHEFVKFNWEKQQATGQYKKREWQLPLAPGTMDRLLVNLALIRDVCGSNKPLSYQVIKRGKSKVYQYQRNGIHNIQTALGDYDAIKLTRQHSSNTRKTISWHAPALNYIPIKVEHIENEKDGNLMMILSELN